MSLPTKWGEGEVRAWRTSLVAALASGDRLPFGTIVRRIGKGWGPNGEWDSWTMGFVAYHDPRGVFVTSRAIFGPTTWWQDVASVSEDIAGICDEVLTEDRAGFEGNVQEVGEHVEQLMWLAAHRPPGARWGR